MIGFMISSAVATATTTTAFTSFVDGLVITIGTYAITKGSKNAITIKK